MKPATIIQHPIHGLWIIEAERPDGKLSCVFGGEMRRLGIGVKRSELSSLEPDDLSLDNATDAIYLLQWMVCQAVEDSKIFQLLNAQQKK